MLFALTDSDFPLLQAVIGISISINSQWKIWNGTEIFQMLVCRAFFILCWLGPPLYRGTCVWCRALIAAIPTCGATVHMFRSLWSCLVWGNDNTHKWYGLLTSTGTVGLTAAGAHPHVQVVCVLVPACVNTQHTSVSLAHTGGNFCLVVYGV